MSPEKAFCSNCGAHLEDSDRFCPSCGTPVEGAAAASPPPPSPTPTRSGLRMSGPVLAGIGAVIAVLAIGGTLLLTGGDEADTGTTLADPGTTLADPGTTTTEPAATTTTASTMPAGGAIAALEDVRNAVVRIETTGTFVYPEGAQFNQPGGGSGFIIDDSGLAVTNNHVVTGAAAIEVFIEGEDRPRNAFVVGVSECSDLAVIDIDGDGYPYLDWYADEVMTGMEIFAAGYPLGDPEYTLLEGIVSKADADGESSWASVDEVLEHTANTLPGNSGGPIITPDGAVVGINYAGNQLGQHFAISADLARPIVDRLSGGENVDFIGINGEALTLADGSYGIWVYSVEAGSPADELGILPGDLLWTLEGADIGEDGTMSSYCDVLRSHAPGSTLDIQVFRPDTGVLYAGQINGRQLEAVFTPPEPTNGDTAVVEVDYVDFTDSTGYLYMQVPSTWDDVFETTFDAWGDGSVVGPQVYVAPDLGAFEDSTGPGVTFLAVWDHDFSLDEFLDAQNDPQTVCAYDGRESFYDGSYYEGLMETWVNCNGDGTVFNIAALPPDGSYMVGLRITAFSDADYETVAQIIRTFYVIEGT